MRASMLHLGAAALAALALGACHKTQETPASSEAAAAPAVSDASAAPAASDLPASAAPGRGDPTRQ